MAPKSKKGFFLTMMALAILSFMLLTVQVWVQVFEQGDIRAAGRFKGESMRIALASISDKSFSDFANASAFFAMDSLAEYASVSGQGLAKSPPREDNDQNNPGTALINRSIYALMYNGTTEPSSGKPITYPAEDWQAYTMLSWQQKISKAANLTGFNVSFSEMKKFNLTQPDAWHVNVYFEVDMNISDIGGAMRQQKTLKANSTFSINGFLDPMVTRKDMENRNVERQGATEKQIWKNAAYETPDSVKPVQITAPDIEQGFGWFSGPITHMYPDRLNASEKLALKQYVLVAPFNGEAGEKMVRYRSFYGAIIVTTPPNTVTERQGDCEITTQYDCLNCLRIRACPDGTSFDIWANDTKISATEYVPVLVTAGSSWENGLPPIKRSDGGGTEFEDEQATQRFVLFDNTALAPLDQLRGGDYYHKLWDINPLRDMTTCGFYVAPGSSGQQAIAPSFFQRLLEGAESDASLRSGRLGIESFVVGQWAGGAEDPNRDATDAYSRLDWEFYSEVGGTAVKGMPGCKDKAMCNPPPGGTDDLVITKGVGRFRLSTDTLSRYNADEVACGAPNSAPCTN